MRTSSSFAFWPVSCSILSAVRTLPSRVFIVAVKLEIWLGAWFEATFLLDFKSSFGISCVELFSFDPANASNLDVTALSSFVTVFPALFFSWSLAYPTWPLIVVPKTTKLATATERKFLFFFLIENL